MATPKPKEPKYIGTAQVTRRMNWQPRTVYKKLVNTRRKTRAEEELTPRDIPLPANEGAANYKTTGPRWLSSVFEEWAKRYDKIRAGEVPDDEEMTS